MFQSGGNDFPSGGNVDYVSIGRKRLSFRRKHELCLNREETTFLQEETWTMFESGGNDFPSGGNLNYV